ncbi:hypothetical protein EC957_009306 [Mortierella hygrophila]|uniref:Uncharacterized protein n=1 Tax=Mortierella hygrophila TaxID=979708 RepID=A0A9P6FC40_9FUNG|nr:hypothetical protein EC957_009306 [Mortierella hygrophila]
MVDDQLTSDTFFQTFRVPDEREPIQIPVVIHPTLNELYVLWSDITDCFPRATRIQFKDVYVPKLRDARLYRVRPHGIRFHPGMVLDIIYGKRPVSRKNTSCSSQDTNAEIAHKAIGEASDQDVYGRDEHDNTDGGNFGEEEQGTRSKEQQQLVVVESGSSPLEDTSWAIGTAIRDIPLADDERDLQTEEEEEEEEDEDEDEEEDMGENLDEEEEVDEVSEEELWPPTHQLSSGFTAGLRLVSSLSGKAIDPEAPLDIRVLVKHRAQDIIKDRVSLSHCSVSKYFFFLLILEDATALPVPTSSTPSQPTHTGITTVGSKGLHGSTKFQLYYLCDCGDIPGFKGAWRPHWHSNDGKHPLSSTSDESFSHDQLVELIPQVGEYMMAVLEMLKYGVYVEEVPQSAARRVSLAIEYLESEGVRSCEKLMDEISLETASVGSQAMLDQMKPTAPLDSGSKTDVENCIFRLRTRKHPRLYPFRASMGDVRRVCQGHLLSMLPRSALEEVQGFSADPSSSASKYDYQRGVFSARITSMQRAREFFRLAAQIPSIPVFRISLEWVLSVEDEQEISDAIGGLSAAVVHLTVPTGTGAQKGAVSGCADGFEPLIFAALQNPKVETFSIFKRPLDAGHDYPEFLERRQYYHSPSKLPPDTLASVSRGSGDSRVSVALRVRNARQVIASVRRAARGLHNLSELCLQVMDVADITIDLRGSRIEDTDFNSGELLSFFTKRHWSDEVGCSSSKVLDTAVSQLGCLTEVRMGLSLEQDRAKVRDLIKLNEGLKSLEMKYRSDEDPSNIFEAFKALLFKHPRIESFKVVKHQIFYPREDSVFLWRNLREPAKMRVEISCYGGDNIYSMFQRYTKSIERLRVAELRLDEAAVLEKSIRSKKGPLALKHISIVDVHLMEPSVRNILQKIILQRDIEEVVVEGKLKPDADGYDDDQASDDWDTLGEDGATTLQYIRVQKIAAVEAWMELLCAIRSKVTELDVKNYPRNRVLKALESRLEDSLDMPRLRSLSLSNDVDTSVFSDRWLETLLRSKAVQREPLENGSKPTSPPTTTITNSVKIDPAKEIMAPVPTNGNNASQAITELCMHGVKLSDEEWERLLGYLDFSQVVKFEVYQRNPMSSATLLLLADVFLQSGTSLRRFVARGRQAIDKATRAVVEEKLSSKSIDGGLEVDLNMCFMRNTGNARLVLSCPYE